MITVLAIILTFSIVVFVHELGHFIVALNIGVKVEAFSLGFGPEILGKTHKGIRYRLSLLPLGGYVKMKGETPVEEGSDDSDSFIAQSPVDRLKVLFAGPFMNFLTGALIFSVIMYFMGLPQAVDEAKIGGIIENSPAMEAGIKEGDKVLSINGTDTSTWEDVTTTISKNIESELNLKIERNGEIINVTTQPDFMEPQGRKLIGISPVIENVKPGLLKSFYEGFKYTGYLIIKILNSIWEMISGQIAPEVAGPVGIGGLISDAAGRGLSHLFQFIAIISINLGLINLFPIPVLDGGHITFALIEKLKGSPLDEKKVGIANMVGLALLLLLLIFVTWKDIARLFL
ncbi:MAG: RIP metalloprotease RseP [Elusimicrobiota bacterium]